MTATPRMNQQYEPQFVSVSMGGAILSSTPAPMSAAEAAIKTELVKEHVNQIGALLIEIRDRRGWAVMLDEHGKPYPSWTAYLAGEFTYARSHLYELMRAATVREVLKDRLSGDFEIKPGQATVLAQFPQDLWAVIYSATANTGKVTESRLLAAGSVLMQTYTGHVDIDAERPPTPIDAALTDEDVEIVKRKRAYIQESAASSPAISGTVECWIKPGVLSIQVTATDDALTNWERLSPGAVVRIYLND